jgi:signal transduction histidine kinase/CheY-like chemotaxis protein
MSKILLVDNNEETAKNITQLLTDFGYEIILALDGNEAINLTNTNLPDIVLIDATVVKDNLSSICKSLKFYTQTNDIQILLLTPKNTPPDEVLAGADGYITKPFSDNILLATINAHLRIKKLLDILYTNNSELAKSLYQLNVLYNTSSQFAGTLDKNKLLKIMNHGLEKSLKNTLCCTLVLDEEDPRLLINATNKISDDLLEVIKARIITNYIEYTGQDIAPIDPEDIHTETNYRKTDKYLNPDVLEKDTLFSAINVADKPFGAVEIFRDAEFSGEDVTCFQTVVKQVSLPLESAILYEEIKEKNIKLEKLEKLKSEFISIVSHELRTPLTAIKSSIDIIQSGRAGETTSIQEKFLTNAKRNVDRLSAIINDLLDLSKIEAGKMDFKFALLDVTDPLNHVISTFKPVADTKNIAIETNFDEHTLPNIYGDCSKLEQVFSNLVSNAIKFTPANGSITISCKVVSDKEIDPSKFSILKKDPGTINLKTHKKIEGDYLEIEIEDTGIGIAKEDLHKVFDKFQQIESSLSREVGGTGLGLAIAKQLVDNHRGEIWVESSLGSGSRFCMILPVARQGNIFLLELDSKLQQSKISHSSLALLTLTNNAEDNRLMMKEVSNKIVNIFRKDDQSKFLIEDNIIKIILLNTDKIGADNVLKRIKKQLKEIKEIDHSKLVVGVAIYPDDAISSEELIDLSQKNTELLAGSI